MKKSVKRLLATMLSLVVVATSLTPIGTAEAKEELVNVAPKATVIADKEDTQWGGLKTNVNDGDDSTHWAWPSSDEWPVTIQLDLEQTGTSVSKVVVKLGGGDVTGRTADVLVQRAQNGITSDLSVIGEKQDQAMGSDVVFELSPAMAASDIYVTLSNPKTNGAAGGTFWPAIREIEVYEAQDVRLSAYNNIAAQAAITTDGNIDGNGPASNLVDGSDATLFKYHGAAQDSEKYILLSYASGRKMDAARIAFEHVGETDSIDFSFKYSILGKNASDTEWTTIVSEATANRTTNFEQSYSFDEKVFNEVKIVMHECKTYGGTSNGWPAVAEFELYGSEEEVNDSGSIAFGKPVHASSGKNQAKNITDGSKNSLWTGNYYPAYVDIDLEANYYLDTVEVYTPESGYSQYTIYTSMDGRDFDKLAEKTSKDSASLENGEVYQANRKEARYIRVYLEYNSASSTAVINEVRATGELSGTELQVRPEINVVDFEQSEYANKTVTDQDTYNEVYGIVERRLGASYKSWFTFELAQNPKDGHTYDYFELSMREGKVHIKGNDGVSLATGLNHYLKYFCNVNISQVGDQVNMPAEIAVVTSPVFKETKAEVRYSYNYCTLSYSMAFWGEQEWRDELDWLALNGVNVVLDATAQEEVWRRFLGELGYSHEDIKDFIAGPAYYAWAYMANLTGFGGPIHDSWFEERTELARKNQQIMRNLGMQPVLQGYSGMVPTDIRDYDPNVEIIEQGTWCSFRRPDMLKTTSQSFERYAALFYKCQKEVYGSTSHYYATDPFHEGGNTGGMNAADISEKVLNEMLKADQDCVWIIQSWQGNPSSALLSGLDRVTNGTDHAIVLDLYAEKDPHYDEGSSSNWAYGYTDEFDDTPWLFCMLNNFGGRLGLHGHLDNLANNIPTAFNNCDYIAGIGITPEASVNNPVLYDFLFETIWQDDASQDMQVIDLDSWLDDYATRRYGAESESAQEAWTILKDTVYKAELNMLGQGAPESVVNARPALSIGAASTWGNAVISYDKVELEKAAALLLEDYDTLKDSEGYMYDLANVLQQVLSNSAQEYQKKMASAYRAGNVEDFERYAAIFMGIIADMEKVTGTSEYFLLGRWVEQAKALAKNADDFTKELYEFNAKALVTTWGSFNQAESGGLKDYSNRQWSGLIGDFYKVRWERWITARTNELKGETYENSINWFQWEWEWVRSNKEYSTNAVAQDLKTLGGKILEQYTVTNPAADASKDVDPTSMSVTAGTQSSGDIASNVLDGKANTIWHSNWSNGTDTSSRNNHYLIFTFDELTTIDGMRFLQRAGSINGVVTKYDLYVSTSDSGEDWTLLVDDGELSSDSAWQKVSFNATNVKRVKLQVVDAMSDQPGNLFASAAEIRFTKVQSEECTHEFTNYVSNNDATCTADGTKTAKCEKCDVTYTIQDVGSKLGHNFETYVSNHDATCTMSGSKTSTCTRCEVQDTIPDATQPALGHAFTNYVSNHDATCTADGTKTAKCDRCDKTNTVIDEGSMKPHSFGDWTVVKEATEEEEGLEERVCTSEGCTEKEQRPISKLPTKPEEPDKPEEASKELLEKYYNECLAYYKEAGYTANSWKAYEAAIANAKAILADENATPEEIRAAIQAIEAAAGNLEKAPETPEKPDESGKKDESVQTGDAASMMVWIMFMAAACAVIISRKRRMR